MKTLLNLVALVSITLSLFVTPPTVTAQTKKCTCQDRDGLMNLLNEANAALDVIELFSRSTKPTDLVNEISMPGGPTKQQQVDKAIYDAQMRVRNPLAKPAACGGYTNYSSMPATTMVDYLNNLKNSNLSIVQSVLRELNALDSTCRPDDWFGIITIKDNFKIQVTQEAKAKNKYEARWDKGGMEEMETTQTRTGTIRMGANGGNTTSTWLASVATSVTKAHSQLTKCESKPDAPDVAITRGSIEKWDTSGGGSLDVDYSINESADGKSVDISVWIPTIETTGTYVKIDTVRGGCKETP